MDRPDKSWGESGERVCDPGREVAGAILVFGMVNAVAILGSAAFLPTALDVVLFARPGDLELHRQ